MPTATTNRVTNTRTSEAEVFIVAPSTVSYRRKNACAQRRHGAKQDDIDREIEQRPMPDEAIDAEPIKQPLDGELQQEGYAGKDDESREIDAVDVEFAGHETILIALSPESSRLDKARHQGRASGASRQSRRRRHGWPTRNRGSHRSLHRSRRANRARAGQHGRGRVHENARRGV